MPQISVQLNINANDFIRLYQGVARDVVAISLDGRNVRFPAAILRPFVSHDGVQGRFVIEFDEAGKFVAVNRA